MARVYREDFKTDCGGWIGWGMEGTAKLEISGGAVVSRSPWWVDYNHAPPGGGYLHLLFALHTTLRPGNRWDYIELAGINRFVSGGFPRDFTNARITARLKGEVELRGAGNILGSQQSGHIAQVGYDMYCRLLSKTVSTLRDEETPEITAVTVGLTLEAYLPEEYVPRGLDRVELYRRIAGTRTEEELAREGEELRDRFGPLPEAARRFLDVQRLRIRLGVLGIVVGDLGGRELATDQPVLVHLPIEGRSPGGVGGTDPNRCKVRGDGTGVIIHEDAVHVHPHMA